MQPGQSVKLMELLRAAQCVEISHPERGQLAVEAMDIVHASNATAEQLANLFDLEPKKGGMTIAQEFGVTLLWAMSRNSEGFAKSLALAHEDMQRESPFFLGDPIGRIAPYFCHNMAGEVCKGNPSILPPRLIDAQGRFTFDVPAYMRFFSPTLHSEVTEAMQEDVERFAVMVHAIKGMPDVEAFQDLLESLTKHPVMREMRIDEPAKRALLGEKILSEEILSYVDYLASTITLGDLSLEEKQDFLANAHKGIQLFLGLDAQMIADHIHRKLDFTSNEDLKWELHSPHKSTAMLLGALDPTGELVARSFAAYKGVAFESRERLLEAMVAELSDEIPDRYLGNRDVWLSGAILKYPVEQLMKLQLDNAGWLKVYQLTEQQQFKDKIRGKQLDRVLSQDLGL